MYDSETAHRRSPRRGLQSSANGIFVHLLYGSVQIPKVGPEHCTYAVSTYIIRTWERPIVQCTPSVRFRDRSQEITTLCTEICSQRHLRAPAVRICTVPQTKTQTVHLGCVYTNYTYLGYPVAHCTPGVRLRYRSQKFNTLWTAILSKRHFRTPAVQIWSVLRSSTPTVHLGFLFKNYTYLGGPVAYCIIGVRLQDRSSQFTIP